MKRFFCTICKRVKRVRNFPKRIVHAGTQRTVIFDNDLPVNPTDRIGQCESHSILQLVVEGRFNRAHTIVTKVGR